MRILQATPVSWMDANTDMGKLVKIVKIHFWIDLNNNNNKKSVKMITVEEPILRP